MHGDFTTSPKSTKLITLLVVSQEGNTLVTVEQHKLEKINKFIDIPVPTKNKLIKIELPDSLTMKEFLFEIS